MFAQLKSQAKALAIFLVTLYLLPLCLLVVVVIVSWHNGIDVGRFTRDPTAVAHVHPFTGALSSFGAMLWAASAAICLFGWAIFRHVEGKARFSQFLFFSGLLTVLFLIDDVFLFHEWIFPRYLGLSEGIVLVIYGVLVLRGIVEHKKCILETDYLILLIALGCFGLSLFIDEFGSRTMGQYVGHWRVIVEDGYKLLGIVGWFGYFSRSCFVAMRAKREQPSHMGVTSAPHLASLVVDSAPRRPVEVRGFQPREMHRIPVPYRVVRALDRWRQRKTGVDFEERRG
ncbi:MAG: hypothetical protein JSW58_00645 [Candidatus Latescibacterota bacterium]|nr:MAG: hypothetical protein JSW58_00645 [Candidatus Latescibacterota bacterium]